jgi:hypothetical protein
MPRISALTLDQVNRQIDVIDTLQKQVQVLQQQTSFTQQQSTIADPIHAPATSNNVAFTWTGSTGVLSWANSYIKDKNWNEQTTASPAIKSSSKGQQHVYTVLAGSLTLSPSTYYWLGWDAAHQTMIANADVSQMHSNYNVHIICQIYTGTAGQTGSAGGGGSTSGVDLSGLRYKNF